MGVASQVMELTAGPELDKRVAREVLGCTRHHPIHGICVCPDQPHYGRRYSRDIVAAWEVMEELRLRRLGPHICGSNHQITKLTNEYWVCAIECSDTIVRATANRAPLAICLAALKVSKK